MNPGFWPEFPPGNGPAPGVFDPGVGSGVKAVPGVTPGGLGLIPGVPGVFEPGTPAPPGNGMGW
ncbi:MAG: hypothetical protein ABL994_15630, partial [Verrucomicrobiales bacterium]